MSKVKLLPSKQVLDGDDVIYVVDDSVGVNGGRKAKISDLKSSIALTDAEVKTKYENNADTNVFTDSEKTKLGKLGPIAQKVIVQLSPTEGQFDNVQDALNSITDATASKPYCICVGPGVFSSPNSIQLKPFVSIRGDGGNTRLHITDETKSVIIGAESCQVSDLALSGSGVGASTASLITYNGSPNPAAMRMVNVSFENCHSFMEVTTSPTSPAIVVVHNCYYSGTKSAEGVSLKGTGVGLVFISDFTYNGTSPLDIIETMFYAEGLGSQLILSDCAVGVAGSGSGQDAIVVENGATFNAQSIGIQNFDQSVLVKSGGAGPVVNISSLTIVNSNVMDINILNGGTTGFINGAFERGEKVFIQSGSTLALTHSVPSGGFSVIGDLYQANTEAEELNFSRMVRKGTTLGIIEGGELSDGGGLTVNYNSGSGFLKTTGGFIREVIFDAGSLIIDDSENNHFIYIDENGDVQSDLSPPVFDDVLFLGRVSVQNGDIQLIERAKISMVQYSNKLEDLLRLTFGPIYRSGSIVTEEGVRGLSVTAGHYNYGTESFLPSGGTGISWSAYYKDGAGDFEFTTQSIVDNAQYDDGSGVLAPIPSGKWIKHALYVVEENAQEKYILVYGQEVLDTLVIAQGADIPTPPDIVFGAVVLIGTILVQEGVAGLIEISDERPVLGFKAGGISAASDHGNLSGLLDDDHFQYLPRNGVRGMSANLNLNSNNIVSVGTVDGRDVSVDGSKLDGIESGATADQTASEIETLYEGIANTNKYTDAEKTKLAGLETSKFLGEFASLGALQSAFPSPAVGSYANVDAGASNDVERYVWDSDNTAYVRQLGVSSLLTDAQIKTQYENNADTNAFTDSEKTKLSNIEANATADSASVTTPPSVGATGSAGTDTNTYANANHTHAHGDQAGGTLHAIATVSAAGFMSAADKVKLDNGNSGNNLNYSNSASQSEAAGNFVSVSLPVDRESFGGSQFTKVNATDFRANFSGQVEVSFKINAFSTNNNVSMQVIIQRNSTDLSWTATNAKINNSQLDANAASACFVLNCTANDIFRLRFRATSGNIVTIPVDGAYMSIKLIRLT